MAAQMEIYQSQNSNYPANVSLLTDFTNSADVTVVINEAVAGTGWAATGTHTGLAGTQCGIFYGNGQASNAVPATSPGAVTCQTPP